MAALKLKRYEGNPILKPHDSEWESRAVFNPAAIMFNNKVYLLYRAIGNDEDYISRFGLAVSDDGLHFEDRGKVFEPAKRYDHWACEDPRITWLNNEFYITYVALSKRAREGGGPPATALLSTTNFEKFKRHGIITPRQSDNRDVVLFPEKINDKYVALFRPHRWTKTFRKLKYARAPLPREQLPEKPSIWLAYSFNLKQWFDYKVIAEPQFWWEAKKIGAGPPPIKTEAGWLVIYHGVDADSVYRAGALLLDLKNPEKIIARTQEPILEPAEDYEKEGDAPNVVFPEGVAIINDTLFVYYGAADKVIGVATINLKSFLEYMLNECKVQSEQELSTGLKEI